eukprot:CAMPEP_0174853290 /NCGR_PEP_ID=MMETSP1114-20130205/27819_1 /TAXON_ID=312471 /ORGANISM="Neobodo designis, Strain CCAP 1951/1" /LENGTH=255 /DNA_ID=CAMNT_0016087925 /DNA_START=50 /DNA_END=817 /DNA_ORIENTATION=+
MATHYCTNPPLPVPTTSEDPLESLLELTPPEPADVRLRGAREADGFVPGDVGIASIETLPLARDDDHDDGSYPGALASNAHLDATFSLDTHAAAAPPLKLPEWEALAAVLDEIDAARRAAFTGPPHGPAAWTFYHSSSVPDMPLSTFARALCDATGYGVEGLAVGLALMHMREERPSGGCTPLDAMTMHRVLLACVVLGAKANFDHYVSNGHVALMAGLHLGEMNRLEAHLLDELEFRAVPPAHLLATTDVNRFV